MLHEPALHIRPLGRTYERLHPSARVGVVLLHGFADSPYRMRDLADWLFAEGYSVFVPRLPGHASRLRYFRQARLPDWQAAVHEAMMRMRQRHARVAVIGRSFGGVLAMLELADHPASADALVTLGAPSRVRRQRFLLLLLPFLGLVMRNVKKPWAKPEDRVARLEMGRYEQMPIPAVLAYLRTNLLLRDGRLQRVQTPTLLMQGRQDAQAHPESVDFFLQHLGSAVKESLLLDRATHDAETIHGDPEVRRTMLAFLRRYCG